MLFLAAYIVLSSAKFESSTSLINKNKSFLMILNKMGPNIEPLSVPLFLHPVFYVLSMTKVQKNYQRGKPYASCFALSKS